MRARFFESLRARLVMLVALALVPAIALTAYTALEQRELQSEQVERGNLRVARLLAHDQQQLGDQTRQVLTALQLTYGTRWAETATCERALAALDAHLPYDNLGAFDDTGEVACSVQPVTPSIRAQVDQARALDMYVVGGYDIDVVRHVSFLTFALPFHDKEGDYAGTIFATARADWFSSTAAKTTLPEGSIALVATDDGRVLARAPHDDAWIGRPLDDARMLDEMRVTHEGVVTLTDADGVERIYAFTPVYGGTEPLYVAVGVPREAALAPVSAAFLRDVTTLAVVGGVAFVVAWVVSDIWILRHMRRLVGATLRLRSGVMTARSGIARGHGEFSDLARWFDEMAAALEREHEELRRLGRLELYKLLAENATDLISRLTPQGSILYASPASRRLLDHPPEALQGRFLTGLAHAEDIASTRAALHAALERDEPVIVTHRLRRRDGAFAWVETTAQAVRDERGQATELIAVSRDVTERMRAQAELEEARRASETATRAKSEFLANMSHEIRTPMNAVIGMTSLLQETTLDEEQREFVDTIRSSGDHLLSIINDILDFSKIESQRLELEHHAFALRACVEESLDLVSGAAAHKGLELVCDVSDAAPEVVIGDAGRLRQVLANLLSNAVKFTHEGEVVVTVDATPLSDGRHDIHVQVRDTGIGIPADRIDRLFRPFSQVDASTTRHYGGSGLGLAISRHLCERMEGRIWVESQEGRGSTFHATVRLEAAPGQVSHVPDPGLAGRRVLVVDDNATNRRILSVQLARWGIIVRETGSPLEALAWVRAGDAFDAGVLDHRMPEMDGAALAAAIREQRDARELPLVLLSSIGHGRGALRPGGAAFDATISKPVKPCQLHEVLVRALSAGGTPPRPSRASVFDGEMARRQPMRILLVEDNAVNQKVALRILARLGYQADVAGNGVEAVQATERQRYDLVLMDVQMPEMDGLEATRRIRQRADAPRVVAMTAHASAGDRDACLAAGMEDYLTKPIHVEQLTAALDRAWQARPATQRQGATTR